MPQYTNDKTPGPDEVVDEMFLCNQEGTSRASKFGDNPSRRYGQKANTKSTRLHKSRSSRSELEFDLSNFV